WGRPWPSVAIAVMGAVVAIGVALGIGVLLASGSPRPGTAAAPPSPAPPSSSPSAPSSSGPARSAGKGSGSGNAVPAGFYRFTDASGFSIAVPKDWRISHQGHYVYVTDPANHGVFLLIDQSDQPKPDPLADWEQQQASREGSFPDYHLIRLAAIDYPQAEKAADWEFTYERDGVRTRVLNRNVLANARHAYALYWTAPASDWTGDYRYFRAFATSFRPAV
ncbi:MAG: hypothetical protein J2P26_05625, partial [Nocardiopsaceae bacterium]|nr:hypothetical protein [Nocardiopsaceae bacterium]